MKIGIFIYGHITGFIMGILIWNLIMRKAVTYLLKEEWGFELNDKKFPKEKLEECIKRFEFHLKNMWFKNL